MYVVKFYIAKALQKVGSFQYLFRFRQQIKTDRNYTLKIFSKYLKEINQKTKIPQPRLIYNRQYKKVLSFAVVRCT